MINCEVLSTTRKQTQLHRLKVGDGFEYENKPCVLVEKRTDSVYAVLVYYQASHVFKVIDVHGTVYVVPLKATLSVKFEDVV